MKSHPLLSYFAPTFAISWGGMLLVIAVGGSGGVPMLAWVAGPPVSGILLTGLLYGRAGFRDLLRRMTKWRLGARWYAIALLTAPLLFTGVNLALSLTYTEFLPSILTSDDRASVLLMGIFAGLMVGFFEELGWRGFAVPTLLRLRCGVLSTGLIVGVPWAVWHLLVTFWASGTISGEFALASYLIDPFLFLVAFRVLMVWVYDRSGSLLLAILMHTSLTASSLILGAGVVGIPLLTFDLIWAAVLWIVVAVVTAAKRGHLSRQPASRRWVA